MKDTTITDPYALAEALGLSYVGDVNPEYGGTFADLSNWEDHGYADVIRTIDLDSACGFTGGVLIEHVVVNKPDDMSRALACVGWTGGKPPIEAQVDACLNYGHFDPDFDMFDATSEIITTDPESWEDDGWRATKHVDASDLLGYLNAEWLPRIA